MVHDLATAAAVVIESGLLFATDAKARVGGLPLLHIACFVARGHIVSGKYLL